MEYPMSFDADSSNSYLPECKDGWTGVPYELWSIESSFCHPAQNASSPIGPSLPSDCLLIEPATNSFSRARTSSIVSPTVSAWSESVVTPPVTPQRNERWYTLTPSNISLKPLANPCFAIHDPADVHVLGGDLWIPKDWHLSSLPSFSNHQILRPELDKSAVNEDSTPVPFQTRANDPALSRHMFPDMTSSPTYQTLASYRFHWSHVPPWSTPETIAPKATVQTTIVSSPLTKIESSSPFKVEDFEQSGIGIDSSPLPVPSPCVVPSQSSVDNFQLMPDTRVAYTQPVLTRKLYERSNRRSQHRKALTSMTCRPRKAIDGVACDAVIPQNTFACNFPGCIDKSTGKQKRFKRQEHRKRHEITVHKTKGDKKYYCWVPGCTTGFNRTDNLKNHINSTHGKNNPAQRNRYVATLDTASKYYNPSWQGELTDDGYPLIQGVTRHQCRMPNCEKTYHLDEKLKAHLLQQHGIKSTGSDASQLASIDENSDSPDPDCKVEMMEDSSAARSI